MQSRFVVVIYIVQQYLPIKITYTWQLYGWTFNFLGVSIIIEKSLSLQYLAYSSSIRVLKDYMWFLHSTFIIYITIWQLLSRLICFLFICMFYTVNCECSFVVFLLFLLLFNDVQHYIFKNIFCFWLMHTSYYMLHWPHISEGLFLHDALKMRFNVISFSLSIVL